MSISSRRRKWLSETGEFLFGKYKAEHINDVAYEDPKYLRWILNEISDIHPTDSERIEDELILAGKD